MTADVIVVGGGVVGASIAWGLARGAHDVCWLTGGSVAGSATAAAGAMLAVFSEVSAGDDPARQAIEVGARLRGRRLWDEWLPLLGQAAGVDIAVSGGIHVVGRGPGDLATLAAIRAAASAAGAASEVVAPADVPGLHADADARPAEAVHLPAEAAVDIAALLGGLHAAVGSLPNVTVVPERAARICPPGRLVTASGETLGGGDIVLAGGVETTALLADSGLDGAVPALFGGRGVSLVVRAPEPAPACVRTPNRSFACGLHVVPRAGGLTYLGGTNRLSTLPEAGVGPHLSEVDDLIGGCVRELDTGLRRAELVSTAVGYRPVTVDRLPLVGRTAVPGLLVATGTWRNGIVLAPMLAELIADEVARPGTTAAHPFAPTRVMDAPPLDGPMLARAADGIVTAILAGTTLAPGRVADLTAFVGAALERACDPDGPPDRSVARLLGRAPMEEVLPLVFDLLARRRR